MTRRAAIGCETGVHPAVAGWRAFAGTATEPTAVETIARSPKSAVYRLRGVSRSGAAIIAKAQSGRSGRFIGTQAIQLHGGIGMTNEYVVGHCLKQLMVIDSMGGGTAAR